MASPTLALVAIFSWLVPVAMIYPPGALVVDRVTFPINSMSVFQPDDRYVSKDLWTSTNGFTGVGTSDYTEQETTCTCNATMICDYM
jgi:hypothetical protein